MFTIRVFLIISLVMLIMDSCHLSNRLFMPTLDVAKSTSTFVPTEKVAGKVWTNQDLSLIYPNNFYHFNEIWPNLGDDIQDNPEYQAKEILNLGDGTPGGEDGYTYRIAVMQRPFTLGLDMEKVYDDTYSTTRLNYPNQEFTRIDTTIDGKQTVQFTLQKPHGEPWWRLRDIWVVCQDSIYIVTCWAYPDSFEKGLPYFEDVIKSININN